MRTRSPSRQPFVKRGDSADDLGGVAAAFGVMRLQVGDSGILEEPLDERRKGISVHKVGIPAS